MDPEATIYNIIALMAQEKYGSAVQAVADYYNWRVHNGFEPRDGDSRVYMLAAQLADAIDELR